MAEHTINFDLEIGVSDESIVSSLRALAELTDDDTKAHDLRVLADSFESQEQDDDGVASVDEVIEWVGEQTGADTSEMNEGVYESDYPESVGRDTAVYVDIPYSDELGYDDPPTGWEWYDVGHIGETPKYIRPEQDD